MGFEIQMRRLLVRARFTPLLVRARFTAFVFIVPPGAARPDAARPDAARPGAEFRSAVRPLCPLCVAVDPPPICAACSPSFRTESTPPEMMPSAPDAVSVAFWTSRLAPARLAVASGLSPDLAAELAAGLATELAAGLATELAAGLATELAAGLAAMVVVDLAVSAVLPFSMSPRSLPSRRYR